MHFDKCKTLKEGQKRYRKLMMDLHPDQGGNMDDCIRMQEEFEVFVTKAVREQVEEADPMHTKAGLKGRSAIYTDTLFEVCKRNVTVEAIGDWIWAFDAAPADIFSLLMLGFAFSKKHAGWYWTEDKRYQPDLSAFPLNRRPNLTTKDLRDMWGNKKEKDKGYI